ncbi:uncharacterized protein [Parasteatoda tepidariorum]|uniref:uncharacterized protein n=1 Tax=Parasteatoda tepidariorum TaxID=114398 RepID=UPI0039BCF98F
MFKGAKKEDLKLIAEEIGESINPDMKVIDLRNLILNSAHYKNDKDFIEQFADSIIAERKSREEQQAKIEFEKAKIDLEKINLEKAKINAELEKINFEKTKLASTRECSTESEITSQTKSVENYIQSVRALTILIPKRTDCWNLFFSSLERAFRSKNVPQEFKGEILLNLLGEKAINILVYIKDEEINDYEKLKNAILKEYEPTPLICLQNFQKARRISNETHVQFASRLSTSWEQYCRLRNVQDLNSLKELIVSDKLYQSLDHETAMHINIKQEQDWFKPVQMGKECDMYFASKGKSFSDTYSNYQKPQSYNQNYTRNDSKYIAPQLRREEIKPKSKENKINKKLECYICGENHLAKHCGNKYLKMKVKENVVIAKLSSEHFYPSVDLHPLKYVSVYVGGGKKLKCVIDSGTQIFVCNSNLIPGAEEEEYGKIILSSAFGEHVEAKLVKTMVSLNRDSALNYPVECIITLTDKLNVDALIPPFLYEKLISSDFESSCEGKSSENRCVLQKESAHVFLQHINEKDILSEGEESGCSLSGSETNILNEDSKLFSDYCKLKEEQTNCISLEKIRAELKQNKGNFILMDGLIYHKDKILNESVMQLVLPKCRQNKVLKLAHESVFGGHMGVRKTKERIKYSFYWPNMRKDITEFVQTCEGCQLRKTEKIGDRAPITPVVRPELPFEIVNVDVIGPIDPPSSRGHKYVLCLVDQNTRWPEAVPLKSLSAKTTCDALLTIFTRTGIPNVIASDQGTNFKSALTQEFQKCIGSSPRFSCPGYAAANGLVERWNRVLKDMLHHVIREDPRGWDLQLPFLLFSYREVPNTTTGVSPFKLLYGREARGPLSILKSSWSGEIRIPTTLSQSAVDYLQELKVRLEKAAESASLMAADKQKAYSDYFNKRSSVRNFNVGEQVVLLIPDSADKIYARWTGPGEIVKHCSPHSYMVKLPDGRVKQVHVNKIRRFHARVNSIGVIFENEDEFGEIITVPETNIGKVMFDSRLDLEHLSDDQKRKLISLLGKHQELMTGKLKKANVEEHKIRLIPNNERKRPYIYRIPDALKGKVDEQIEELLDAGLIEESSAEIAYPVVCVSKKDGGIDYRALNAVTIIDDFPMEDITELIHTIGKANVISNLDLLKGYYAIPMEEASYDLTSFKTHNSQYRFRVMPFGLRNAAATFQRVMNKALTPFKNFSLAYIDDIGIFSNSFEEHLEHLELILKRLEELNFTVNLKKCSFAKPSIKCLGHIIGSGELQPDPEKVRVIKQLPRPNTKKELRSVLGLCGFYRDYIPKYAELVYPLTELTKKRVPEEIPWSEVHDSVFSRLKQALAEAPSLYTPVPGNPYIIYSDASQIGIGACNKDKI